MTQFHTPAAPQWKTLPRPAEPGSAPHCFALLWCSAAAAECVSLFTGAPYLFPSTLLQLPPRPLLSWLLLLAARSPSPSRPCWPSARRARTRLAGSRSASCLTPRPSASRRANTLASASGTTRASVPGAMRERPASMVTLRCFFDASFCMPPFLCAQNVKKCVQNSI